MPTPLVPRLTDGIVTLRGLEGPDVEGVHRQAAASVMLRLPDLPAGTSMRDARRYVLEVVPEGWATGTVWTFAVEAPDPEGSGARYVGTVALRSRGAGRAELVFGSLPWSRGRGYVVRALRLLLRWGFDERDLQSVLWTADRGNWASRKVAWRLGFSFDGTLRRWSPSAAGLGDDWLGDVWLGVLTAADDGEPRSLWLEVPRLGGNGLVLRRLHESDVPRIVEACSDERAMHWLARLPSPYTAGDARFYLETRREQLATGEGVTWAVTSTDDEELLGVVSVFDLDAGEDGEVGYWMHPAARGRGVMTRACSLVVRHAFVPAEDGGLGLARLRVEVAEGNDASRHVVEANGFVPTGRHRAAHRFQDGTAVDTLCYDLLLEEYRPPVPADER